MRRTSVWRAALLTAAAVLTPGLASAQGLDYAPPDPVLPSPLYTTQPGLGGLYYYSDFVYFHQTNPLKNQVVAVYGFVDTDGSARGETILANGTPVTTDFPGQFVGSRQTALVTDQVRGPGTYEPGFRVGAGWKFHDGSSLEVNFLYIALARFNAAVTGVAPPNFNVGLALENTFLTSFVFNFPPEFAGPPRKTGFLPNSNVAINAGLGSGFAIGNDFAVFGIWNGATIMTLEFVQRAEGSDITYRVPVYETEDYRLSGIVGPRWFWIWERFRWRTTDVAFDGSQSPAWVGLYENITSNRMWGGFIGCENEWYLGHGVACYLNMDGALLLDSVKEKADYQLGIKDTIQNKRAKLDWTAVPEFEGKVGLAWYPYQGIELRVDYNALLFFNTIASPRPIDFNYGGLNPGWDHVTRLFDGFTAGIAIVF
jgi:hypothetical protein